MPTPGIDPQPKISTESLDGIAGRRQGLDVSVPFTHAISFGVVRGGTVVTVVGAAGDIDPGADEDIWGGDGLYTFFPTTAQAIEVLSSSALDTAAGTGAQTVMVIGLDATGNPQSQTVNLNGLTAVAIPGTWFRVFQVLVMAAGSTGQNAGNVTVRQVAGGTPVCAFIQAPGGNIGTPIANRSYQSHYTIPAGKRGMVVAFGCSTTNTDNLTISILIRYPGGVWQGIFPLRLYQSSFGFGTSGEIALSLPALTDIRILARAEIANCQASAWYTLCLLDP
jgi:hypothetical protein